MDTLPLSRPKKSAARRDAAAHSCLAAPASRLLILVLLAFGIFFRFYNLDKKVYWADEMATSLRISGFSAAEAARTVFSGAPFTVGDLGKYQRIRPGTTVLDTIASLGAEEPQHTPLYFALARVWAELFGDSVRSIRSLSAVIGVLMIPSLYWLCRELFGARTIAWLAAAMLAVSPFHVLYAQEARPYALWSLMSLVSSAALLRALRLQTRAGWWLYASTLVIGIYSYLMFALVALAHAIYAAGREKLAWSNFSPYAAASLAAGAAFVPWALLVLFGLTRVQATTDWLTAAPVGFLHTLARWTLVYSSAFIDTGGIDTLKVNYGFESRAIHLVRLPVLLLIGYSLWFLYRRGAERTWLFVLALAGGSALPLLLADVVLGWQLSSHPRFLVPYHLAVLVSVAFLLAHQTASAETSGRRTWRAISIILISGQILSCAVSSGAETWWNKGAPGPISSTASLINDADRPLLIAGANPEGAALVLPLLPLLDPKVAIHFAPDPDRLQIDGGFTDVFLLDHSGAPRQRLEKAGSYRIEAADGTGKLWRIEKIP